MKKLLALILAVTLLVTLFSGCGKQNADNGKTTITIAGWPSKETNPAKYEMYQKYLETYKEMYPDVEVITDEWNFDLKNYLVRAAGNDLPTVFKTAPTELDVIIDTGYIRDITDFMKERKYLENYDETYEHIYLRDDKGYAIVEPTSVYQMGLVVNKKIFEKAGLVEEDGSPKFPKTWDEVTEYAKIIKEKTGKPGYVVASKDRHGGWHFMNLAWSYGANFVEKTKDGKWKACFATEECAQALQYIKDMKWEHDVIQDDLLSSMYVIPKLVCLGEAGMGIVQSSVLVGVPKNVGSDPNDVAMCKMPAGPEGNYALSSANIYVFNANATDAQVEAVLNWFDLIGMGPKVDEDTIKALDESYKAKAEEGEIVGIQPSIIWKDGELKDVYYNTVEKYANVDTKMFESYSKSEGVTFKSDPERMAQQLYDVLDAAIQRVLNDKNADVMETLKEAENNFQKNFLDKE